MPSNWAWPILAGTDWECKRGGQVHEDWGVSKFGGSALSLEFFGIVATFGAEYTNVGQILYPKFWQCQGSSFV